jgi:hypothetical protein
MITIDVLKNMAFGKKTLFFWGGKPGNWTHIQGKHSNSFSTLKKWVVDAAGIYINIYNYMFVCVRVFFEYL